MFAGPPESGRIINLLIVAINQKKKKALDSGTEAQSICCLVKKKPFRIKDLLCINTDIHTQYMLSGPQVYFLQMNQGKVKYSPFFVQ